MRRNSSSRRSSKCIYEEHSCLSGIDADNRMVSNQCSRILTRRDSWKRQLEYDCTKLSGTVILVTKKACQSGKLFYSFKQLFFRFIWKFSVNDFLLVNERHLPLL